MRTVDSDDLFHPSQTSGLLIELASSATVDDRVVLFVLLLLHVMLFRADHRRHELVEFRIVRGLQRGNDRHALP